MVPQKYINSLNKENKEIIDLGSGSSEFILQFHNANLSALDIEEKNLRFLLKKAELSLIDLSCIISDISNYNFDKSYDLISCFNVLHFFTESEAIKIVKRIQKATNLNGLNILSFNPNKLHKDKVLELYENWKIETKHQDKSFTLIVTKLS